MGHNQQQPEQEEQGFFSKLISGPVNFITSIFCGSNSNTETVDELTIFSKLPRYQKDFKIFVSQSNAKLGVLFLFDDAKPEEMSYLNIFVEKLTKIDFIIDILRENCVISSIGTSTNIGKQVNFFLILR